MMGGYAGTTVCSVTVLFGSCLECLDGASPVCVVPRLFEQARWCTRTSLVLVIPAKAGIHFGSRSAAWRWIPASAGMTGGYAGTTVCSVQVGRASCREGLGVA